MILPFGITGSSLRMISPSTSTFKMILPFRIAGSSLRMINPRLSIYCDQDTIEASILPPLSREVLMNNTKIVSEVFKLHSRQRLSQHIYNMLIYAHILELYSSLLHHVTNVEVQDFYVLRLIMEHRVLCHLHAVLVITYNHGSLHLQIEYI